MLHDRQQAQKNSHGLQVVRAVYKIIESRNEVRQDSSLSVSLARASWAASRGSYALTLSARAATRPWRKSRRVSCRFGGLRLQLARRQETPRT